MMGTPQQLKVHDMTTSIARPTLQHQYLVKISIGSTEFPILSNSVVRVMYDLVTSTGSMQLECNASGGVEQALQYICSSVGVKVCIEFPNGQAAPHSDYVVEFIEFMSTKCSIEHDYALSGTLTALLEFSFTNIKSYLPDPHGL